jgi:hypothetical protein
MDISLLDHRRERLLGHASRFQERREVAALAQLGDAPFDRSGTRLPDPVTIAVAVIDSVRAALAMGGAGHVLDFQFH